jgi:DNA topoisomerase-1
MPFIKRTVGGGGSAAGNSKPQYKKKVAGHTGSTNSDSDRLKINGGSGYPGKEKTLIIVESPAKCNKIEGYLGRDNYTCMASYGHIREIEDGLKSIDVDNEFSTKFAVMASKRQQVAKLREAIAMCREVILATDDDREGEAIAWHICDVFKLSVTTTKRIVFHEITESAIKAAIIAPQTVNMSIVHAQQARQLLDIIVGYKISPVLWTYVAHTNLSAGRCQTPALRLVYDNYKEIEASPGTMVYSVSGIFTKLNLTFHLSRDLESRESIEKFIRETSSAPDSAFVASAAPPKKSTRTSPRPYSTSTLQQAANTEIHLSPKDTMAAAQKLYEHGYITYMRTDSKMYSRDFVNKAFDYIKNRWGSASPDSTSSSSPSHLLGDVALFSSADACAASAHEAIRPTDIQRVLLPQSCHPREHRLYAMIWRNTVESVMAPAICRTITMSISSPASASASASASDSITDRSKLEYKYTAEQVIQPGWKLVSGYDTEANEYTYFASIAAASTVSTFPYRKIVTKCAIRNTKSHYTESGLVQMLEKMGIGRPSTFSSLIDKIQERGYVKVQDVRGKSLECIEYILTNDKKIETKIEVREIGGESRKLVIQPLGIMVVEFLMEHFAPLFDYEFTKQMETQLDDIATDGMVWHELCYKCWFEVTTQLQELKERGIVKEEIRIDDNHSYIIGRYGPVIKCDVSKMIQSVVHGEDADDDNVDDDDKCNAVVTSKKPKFVFKPVRKDLEYSKILRGEYSLEYMLGNETSLGVSTICAGVVAGPDGSSSVLSHHNTSGKYLGQYQGLDVVIKNGKFGVYVNWGVQNISLRTLLGTSSSAKGGGRFGKYARKETIQTKSEFDLTLEEVVGFIQGSVSSSSSVQPSESDVHSIGSGSDIANGPSSGGTPLQGQVLRMIDEHSSVRNGRYGPYIFHKTPKMSKPLFVPLKGFPNYINCDIMLLKEWMTSKNTKK